jgi:putative methanogenesis marker protein 5
MAKVIVYPPTSMILSDLVERMGHKALVVPEAVRKLVTTNEIQSPPLNVTPEEPKKGLRYAAVDVPSGVRGRMALIGPLIEEAEAAIMVEDPGWLTGCAGVPDQRAGQPFNQDQGFRCLSSLPENIGPRVRAQDQGILEELK